MFMAAEEWKRLDSASETVRKRRAGVSFSSAPVIRDLWPALLSVRALQLHTWRGCSCFHSAHRLPMHSGHPHKVKVAEAGMAWPKLACLFRVCT